MSALFDLKRLRSIEPVDLRLPPIRGSGGGGGKKGGGGESDPNTLRSRARARMIEVISEGPIEGLVDGAKSIYFDQTPIQNADGTENFKNVVWQEHKGYPDDGHFNGHDAVETPHSVEVQVKKNTGPVQRTIVDQNADAVRIIVRIPALVKHDDKNGGLKKASLQYAIDVRANSGTWVEAVNHSLNNEKTVSPFQISHRVELPFQGSPWDIRIRRITDDAEEDTLSNELWWEGYIVLVEGKFTYPHTAAVAMEVNAEDMGTSIPPRGYHVRGLKVAVPSNYDPIARTYAGIWDGTFKIAWTNNPAWVFYDLILNDRYGLGEFISPDIVDKWSLYTIAQYCDQPVKSGYKNGDTGEDIWEPRFTFNGVINTRDDAYFVLQQITRAWRGMAYWSLGQVFATADMPEDPVKLVTRANVIDGEFSYSGTAMKARHSVCIVSWNDPNDFYRPSKEVVINQEMLNRYGWREKSLQLTGCTSRGLAHRYGKWVLDTEQNETETVEYKASWDHADVKPGNIVAIADPHKAQIRFGGRIVSHHGNEIVLDHTFEPTAGETYQLMLTMPDGSIEVKPIAAFIDDVTLEIGEAFSAEALPNAMFVISGTNITPRQYRVVAMEEAEPNIFKITALFHDPTKFPRVEEGVVFEPLPYVAPPSAVPPPSNINVHESGYVSNNISHHNLLISWTPPQDRLLRGFVVAADTPDGARVVLGTTASTSIEMRDTVTGPYKFYIQSIGYSGQLSEPAELEFEAVGYEGFPLPIVTGFGVAADPASTQFGGPDLSVVWTNEFAGSIDPASDSGTPSPGMSSLYSHNIVRVFNGATGQLLRQAQVIGEAYVYDYASNVADNISVGNSGASRQIRIDVQAFDIYGRSSIAVSRVFSNPVPPAIVPTYQVTGPAIHLGHAPIDDLDFAGVVIWRSETPGIDPLAEAPFYTGTNNPLTIPSDPLTTYYFVMAAFDSFGIADLAYSAEFAVTTGTDGADTTAPDVPTDLSISSEVIGGVVRVVVKWAANTETDLAGYDLEIKQGAGGFVNIPVNAAGYEFNGLAGEDYQFRVRARDWSGNSSAYCPTVAHVAAVDTVAPGTPSDLVAATGLTSVWLRWVNPLDADLAHIEILESETTNLADAEVLAVATGSSFARNGLPNRATRTYWVRAVDTSGNTGGVSASVTATTSELPRATRIAINGLILTPNAPAADQISWAEFQISYGAVGETPQSRTIVAGNDQWVSDSLYLYYVEGETELRTTDDAADIFIDEGHLIAVYRGGTDIQLSDGKAVIDGNSIIAGTVGAQQLVVNDAIITNTLQLADAVVTSAKIESLSAEKIEADTVLAGSIKVDDRTLSKISEYANDPAARINDASTNIDPGKIHVSGATTLADWRNEGDNTKIEGGALASNSVSANKLSIGMRGIVVEDITFEHNDPDPNDVSWTAGSITYVDDDGVTKTSAISAGGASWSANTLYIYWIKGAETLSTSTSIETAQADNTVVLAAYRGGTWLVAAWGRTIIDGGQIKTQSISTDQLKAGAVTAEIMSVETLSAISANMGTITAGKMQSDDGKFVIDLNNKTISIEV